MSKYFTGKGDDGKTGYLGEGRLDKYNLRMEALGSLDELTAALGVARSWFSGTSDDKLIISIQRDLYNLMAEVAAAPENAEKFLRITPETISELEVTIEKISSKLDTPDGFILPGQTQASAAVSLARTIARRAERRVAELLDKDLISNASLLGYLNRLSSLLFVLELKLTVESKNMIRMAKEERL
jgi:cob(I)alamin adenosyltransferase